MPDCSISFFIFHDLEFGSRKGTGRSSDTRPLVRGSISFCEYDFFSSFHLCYICFFFSLITELSVRILIPVPVPVLIPFFFYTFPS